MTKTLIIRYDADLTGMIETDAKFHGYDADAVLESYLDEVERLALAEIDGLDDVDVDRSQADCCGATKSSEILYSDGDEMTQHESDQLTDIVNRALETAISEASK